MDRLCILSAPPPPQPPTPTPLWPFPAHRFHPLSPPSPPHKFLFAPLSRLKLSHPQAVGRGKGREAQAAVSLWLVNDSYNDSETSVCQCPLSLRGNRGILGISFLSHPLAYYPLLPPPPLLSHPFSIACPTSFQFPAQAWCVLDHTLLHHRTTEQGLITGKKETEKYACAYVAAAVAVDIDTEGKWGLSYVADVVYKRDCFELVNKEGA